MTDLTPAAVKAALEAATPGPWDCDYHGIDDCLGDVWQGMDVRICEDATAKDARLIAMAPDLATAYLVLAERITPLEASMKAAEAQRDAWREVALRDNRFLRNRIAQLSAATEGQSHE